MHLTYLLLLIHWIDASILRIFKHQKHIDILTRKEIRRANINESAVNEKTEKTDFKKSENRVFKETENYITEMTEKIEKWNTDKSVKNEFFIKKTETTDKEELIIFSENASLLSTFFFSESRDSEKMKKTAIIWKLKCSIITAIISDMKWSAHIFMMKKISFKIHTCFFWVHSSAFMMLRS